LEFLASLKRDWKEPSFERAQPVRAGHKDTERCKPAASAAAIPDRGSRRDLAKSGEDT
jgi:hypothetical protein